MYVAIPAGYGLGEAAEPRLGPTLASTLIGVVFGLALGAGLGVPQALLLGPHGGAAWAVASSLGGAAGGAVAFGLFFPMLGWESPLTLVLSALSLGLGIGLGQALRLRQPTATAGLWALATTASLVAALAVGVPLGGEGRELIAIGTVGLLAGALTGIARWWLLRPPSA
jgi:hypothetical protein